MKSKVSDANNMLKLNYFYFVCQSSLLIVAKWTLIDVVQYITYHYY